MILTLTPNPSTDRTIELAGPLERGGVLRAAAESLVVMRRALGLDGVGGA